MRASGTFHGSSRDRGRGQTCHPIPRFSDDKTVFGRRALRLVPIDVAPCVPRPIGRFVTPLIHVPQVFPGRLARTRIIHACRPSPRFSGDKTVIGRRALRRVPIDVAPCVPRPIGRFVTPLIHVPQVFPGRLARTRPNVRVRGILQGGVVVLVARTRLVHRPTHCNALRVDGA